MNNQHRALEAITAAFDGFTAPEAIPEKVLENLHRAGLITPDLPERPDGGIWGELGQFLVDTAENGGVAVAPPHPGVITLDSKEARETALDLLAAANHAEVDND